MRTAALVNGPIVIATNAGSIGTLNIGAAAGNPAVAPGTLTAPSLAFGAGVGTLNFNHTSANYVFAPAISGNGTVNVLAGTTILTADNTYTGNTTISLGTLQLGNGGTSGSIVTNVTDNGTLAFDRSDTVTFASVISGSGSVAQIGSGATILTADSTYTGGTTISLGTLQLGNGGTTGSILGDVTDNGTLAFNRSDVVTFPGLISGSGTVAQIGPGTTILTADSTYAGGTTISLGTLQLGNGGTSGSIVGDVADNGTLAFNRSDTVTFAGVISGTGSVAQIGPGTTILTGNSTYTGGTTISLGTLQLGNGGTSGSIIGDVTDNGTLAFNRSDRRDLPRRDLRQRVGRPDRSWCDDPECQQSLYGRHDRQCRHACRRRPRPSCRRPIRRRIDLRGAGRHVGRLWQRHRISHQRGHRGRG